MYTGLFLSLDKPKGFYNILRGEYLFLSFFIVKN
nr:MAG TPA: hypothetical protein [Ackermannviridae sp.]